MHRTGLIWRALVVSGLALALLGNAAIAERAVAAPAPGGKTRTVAFDNHGGGREGDEMMGGNGGDGGAMPRTGVGTAAAAHGDVARLLLAAAGLLVLGAASTWRRRLA